MGKWAEKSYDDELLRKVKFLFDRTGKKLEKEDPNVDFGFQSFVEVLDENDRFVQRLFEFLVKETASRANRQRRGSIYPYPSPFDPTQSSSQANLSTHPASAGTSANSTRRFSSLQQLPLFQTLSDAGFFDDLNDSERAIRLDNSGGLTGRNSENLYSDPSNRRPSLSGYTHFPSTRNSDNSSSSSSGSATSISSSGSTFSGPRRLRAVSWTHPPRRNSITPSFSSSTVVPVEQPTMPTIEFDPRSLSQQQVRPSHSRRLSLLNALTASLTSPLSPTFPRSPQVVGYPSLASTAPLSSSSHQPLPYTPRSSSAIEFPPRNISLTFPPNSSSHSHSSDIIHPPDQTLSQVPSATYFSTFSSERHQTIESVSVIDLTREQLEQDSRAPIESQNDITSLHLDPRGC